MVSARSNVLVISKYKYTKYFYVVLCIFLIPCYFRRRRRQFSSTSSVPETKPLQLMTEEIAETGNVNFNTP